MHRLTKPLLLVALALAIPIVPFLVAGDWFEEVFSLDGRPDEHPGPTIGLIIGVLAVDVFLPVPSSGVGTYAGAKLGTVAGTAAVWLGMTVGAVAGFAVARKWGVPIARRLAGQEELDRLEPTACCWGSWLLLITRPLPILAEAAVLLLGAARLPWRRFWWPVSLANLALAVCYAALGDFSRRHGWLAPAVVFAMVLPLVVAWLARRRLSAT